MKREIHTVEQVDEQGHTRVISRTVKNTAKVGISFGSCLAMVISYTWWHSIPWTIFHGLLSWVYVIYFAIVHG